LAVATRRQLGRLVRPGSCSCKEMSCHDGQLAPGHPPCPSPPPC
jgi:hypothetical protein